MTTREQVAALLQKSAPALLQGDPKALLKLELDVSDIAFRGLEVLAPATVPAGAPLPIVVLMQKSSMRGWEVVEDRNLLLSAYDPDTGALQFAPAFAPPGDQKTPMPGLKRPSRPPPSAEQTAMVNTYRLDAAERLALPRRQATLVLRALAYDWVSNGVRVELEGGAPRPSAPAAIQPMPAADPGRLPIYEPSNRYPPAPETGIAFKIEPLRDGTPVILGSFAKHATSADLLPAPQTIDTASGPRSAIAVVRVAFALVTLDSMRPTSASWAVPVYGRAPAAAGQRISGQFAIELRSVIGDSTEPGRVAYLFMNDQVAGPIPLATTPAR